MKVSSKSGIEATMEPPVKAAYLRDDGRMTEIVVWQQYTLSRCRHVQYFMIFYVLGCISIISKLYSYETRSLCEYKRCCKPQTLSISGSNLEVRDAVEQSKKRASMSIRFHRKKGQKKRVFKNCLNMFEPLKVFLCFLPNMLKPPFFFLGHRFS